MDLEDEVDDASSGSDFDEDEDPDKIQVPGGGKDLASAAGIFESRENKFKLDEGDKSNSMANMMMKMPMNMTGTNNMSSQMKQQQGMMNMPPGYEMMRNQSSKISCLFIILSE